MVFTHKTAFGTRPCFVPQGLFYGLFVLRLAVFALLNISFKESPFPSLFTLCQIHLFPGMT